MSTPVLRGYGITQAADFIQSGYFPPDVARRIMDGLPQETKTLMREVKPNDWYPREHVVHMLRGIALVKNDNVASSRDLAACGRFMASEATNTYLRLFLKMLKPATFAKKMPDVWLRHHRGSGNFEVDPKELADTKLKVRLVGADGFDHVGAFAIGFVDFCLSTMGVPDLKVTQSGWSLTTPSPHIVELEATWKA